jgi:spore coat protein SA
MSHKTPIVIVAPETLPLPPVEGGAVQTVIHEHIKRIRKNITIICPRGKNQHATENKGNVNYIRIELSAKDRLEKRNEYIQQVATKVKDLKPEIIHIHNRPAFTLPIHEQNKDARILLHMHNDHLSTVDRKKLKKIVKRCHKVIFVSHFLQRAANKTDDRIKKKSLVIHNGIDTDHFRPHWEQKAVRKKMREQLHINKRDIVLLYVGRIIEEKGLLDIIRSIRALKKKGARLKLVVVGASEFGSTKMNGYERLVRKEAEKMTRQIRFVGYVEHENIHKFYNMADIFLFPIRWKEPFGLVLCEAAASGLPIISTKKGAVSEIISHNKNGLLLPSRFGPRQLITALKRIVFDRNLRIRMSHRARETMVKHFTWEQSAKKVERLYNGV